MTVATAHQDVDLKQHGVLSFFGKKKKSPKENATCFLVNLIQYISDPSSKKVATS